MSAYPRAWDGVSWQSHAHILVQFRHGAQNVQRIPDKVGGDAGLEFFTTDNCLYQCYAPEEVSDTAKAASGMKSKATRDLKKLKKYEKVLTSLLSGRQYERWILLCPFLDDKSVVNHVRLKGTETAALGLPFLSPNFEALVHCQEDFQAEISRLRGLPIATSSYNPSSVSAAQEEEADVDLASRLAEKLARAYPVETPVKREGRKLAHIQSHIKRNNSLDTLKIGHPLLWERALQTIDTEEQRLNLVGAAGSAPIEQLHNSLERLAAGLKNDVPNLSTASINILANGTLADWLMRCPLDFPEETT